MNLCRKPLHFACLCALPKGHVGPCRCVPPKNPTCTCPQWYSADHEGMDDYAAACAACPVHGVAA